MKTVNKLELYINNSFIKLEESGKSKCFWTQEEWEQKPDLVFQIISEIYQQHNKYTNIKNLNINISLDKPEFNFIEIKRKNQVIEKWYKQEWINNPDLVKRIARKFEEIVKSKVHSSSI